MHVYIAELNMITCAFVLLNIETLFKFYRMDCNRIKSKKMWL